MSACKVVALIGVLLASGCAAHRAVNAQSGVFKTMPPSGQGNRYVIEPPDVITVRAPMMSEIDKFKSMPGPDGQINFPLAGKLRVTGMTPQRLEEAIGERLTRYYVQPDLKVVVLANSKFFTVVGPGQSYRIPFTGADNVIKALLESGMHESPWPQFVLLVRQGRGSQRTANTVINFEQMLRDGDLSQNYYLEPDDVIMLPHEPLQYLTKFKIRELAGPMSPFEPLPVIANPEYLHE